MERFTYQPKPKEPFAYNPFLDRDAYLKASAEQKIRLSPYIRMQLETHIGERFNVLLSTIRYDIRDGRLYPQGGSEPALEMFKRGIGRDGSTKEDIKREIAEVEGFSITEQDLASENARVGDKRLSLSPPSGSYRHKFYDELILMEDESGRYVEMRRYSSGLSIEETVEKLQSIGLVDELYEASPQYSLAHPIKINAEDKNFQNPDDVHKFLHKDHEYTSTEDLQTILQVCLPWINKYIEHLVNNPFDTRTQLLLYNALLNTADLANDAIKNKDWRMTRDLILKSQSSYPTRYEVEVLGRQPVRKAMIGCGASGGFNVDANSPFSVKDKANENSADKKILCCTCPFCGNQVEAEISGGRIECPKCHESASWSN